jgi:hypothetical protein
MNDKDFWRLFGRVLGQPVAPGRYTPAELSAWDSLRHVELVFELEEAFGIDIAQADIAALYSDTDTVLAYLREHAVT